MGSLQNVCVGIGVDGSRLQSVGKVDAHSQDLTGLAQTRQYDSVTSILLHKYKELTVLIALTNLL
jgi:hypothetical protein